MDPVLPHEESRDNRGNGWLLLIGGMVLSTSAFFLWQAVLGTPRGGEYASIFQTQILGGTRVDEVTPTMLVATPTVIQTTYAPPVSLQCIDKAEYLALATWYVSKISIVTGAKTTNISIEEVQHCLSLSEVVVPQRACPVYAAELQARCLEPILKNRVSMTYSMKKVTGVGGSALVRNDDWAIDYEVMASAVQQQVSLALHFDTVVAASTPKSVLVQDSMSTAIPGTDGMFSQRYIEVDGSRQLLFVWEQGEYKTFTMSGAFPEWNPVGVYRIVDKSPLAWSTTANKWMPYWMAFTYDTRQNALLGVHALVYWYPGLQKVGDSKIYEPETNIGTPKSTGCMRLTLGDAQYVYEHIAVGDPIIVYD